MAPIKLALVSTVGQSELPFSVVARVSAAIQSQLNSHLAPIWDVTATIDPIETVDEIEDRWLIQVCDALNPGVEGIHEDDKDGLPFALVSAQANVTLNTDADWSVQASHEALEMVMDPYGKETRVGADPQNIDARVNFLNEICDPVQSCYYPMPNGIYVCDFYTPNFFDTQWSDGGRYSFSNKLKGPREIMQGGYLYYEDGSGQWWRWSKFDNSADG